MDASREPGGPEVAGAPSLPALSELLDRCAGLLSEAAGGRRRVLGIAGPPGAGKTTLVAALLHAVAADPRLAGRVAHVPMDGFHLPGAELGRLGRLNRKGAPDTFDGAGYAALLARLRSVARSTVWAPVYDRSIEESVAGAIAIPPEAEVVVTEGNYLLVDEPPWDAVRDLLDEVWAVRVDPALRTARLVARHVEFGKAPERAAAWVASVDEGNAELVRSTLHRADLDVVLSSA